MDIFSCILSGAAAGFTNGFFGTGGGMILVFLLRKLEKIPEAQIFPTSVAVMLPLTLTALTAAALREPLPFRAALPYMLGSLAGGIAAGLESKNIPTDLLHRIFGGLVLWGGMRLIWTSFQS